MTASIDSSIGKTKVVLAHKRMVITALALREGEQDKEILDRPSIPKSSNISRSMGFANI